MDLKYLQRNYQVSLEELDKINNERDGLKIKLKDAQNYIKKLKR